MTKHICRLCGEPVKTARWQLGYSLCLDCGDEQAHKRKHTIVPMNKSNYIPVTNYEILKQLNPKRTT